MEDSWNEGGGRGNRQVATTFATDGRSARVCDVCSRDRVRWYCAADQAYLCLRCDESIHSANSVASRHLRIRLNPNCKIPVSPITCESAPSDSGNLCQQQKLHKKRRSSRPTRPPSTAPSMVASQFANSAMVKAEPAQECTETAPVALRKPKKEEDDDGAHEVPVLLPVSHAFSPLSVGDCTLLVQANEIPSKDDALGFVVPDGFQIDALLDPGPAAARELDLKVSGEEPPAALKVDEMAPIDDLEVFSLCREDDFCEDYCMDFSCIDGFREAGEPSPEGHGAKIEEVDNGLNNERDGFSIDKVKMEEESLEYGEAMRIEVDEMIASEWNGFKEEEVKQICLRLNYEDVLSAWSDRGPLWADGICPQIVPDASSYEGADDTICLASDHAEYFDTGLVPDFSFFSESSTTGDQPGQVPVVNVSEESTSARGREARVMRYREKRRTRLFSKKIRYEVRKLNAERRPRLKGRFVKKNTS